MVVLGGRAVSYERGTPVWVSSCAVRWSEVLKALPQPGGAPEEGIPREFIDCKTSLATY